MTDGTAHNKGITTHTAGLLEHSSSAGQLFCNVHTSLGFDKGFEDIVNKIENGINMENIIRGFILDVTIDQSSETISFTFVS